MDQYDRAKNQFGSFAQDETVQIEAPSRVVEGVNAVLKYYLCSWAIWRPLRFAAARLTEAVILYIVVPGVKGVLMGAVNPMSALPINAPQIQKDTHALTAHVVRPVVGGTVRTVSNVIALSAASVDAAERARLVANTGEPVQLSPVLANNSSDPQLTWMVNYLSGTNGTVTIPTSNVSATPIAPTTTYVAAPAAPHQQPIQLTNEQRAVLTQFSAQSGQ